MPTIPVVRLNRLNAATPHYPVFKRRVSPRPHCVYTQATIEVNLDKDGGQHAPVLPIEACLKQKAAEVVLRPRLPASPIWSEQCVYRAEGLNSGH